MPAASASPIHPVVDHLIDAVDHQRVGRGVLAVLDAVPDPRKPRGGRHQISTILALAVMAGCRSFTAIGEWAADASEQVLFALGAGCAPSESTMRRALQRLDGDELDRAIGSWAAGCTEPSGIRRRLVAVDGKRVRGSGNGTTSARYLLAAIDHAHAVVLAQREVGYKTNEMWMPLAGRSTVGESRCHSGYSGHFSLIGTYFRLRSPSSRRCSMASTSPAR